MWDDPYLWSILQFCHASHVSRHYGKQRTTMKVLDSGFFGPPFSRILLRFTALVNNANEQEQQSLVRVRCFSNLCFSVNYLMFGALILWALPLFLLVLFTFYLMLIMFKGGLRQYPLGLMIPKLLQIWSGQILVC